MTRAALGFRAHSGWAVVVGVAGPVLPPAIVERRRIELADARTPGSKQPFHAAEPLPLKQAEQLIERCTHQARQLARSALDSVIRDLGKQGYQVTGCLNLRASGRPLTTLAATLASHALIHTAEGEFFRAALADASAACGLALRELKERELFECAARELNLSTEDLEQILKDWGKLLGPPWRQDQKYAALAGWLALR